MFTVVVYVDYADGSSATEVYKFKTPWLAHMSLLTERRQGRKATMFDRFGNEVDPPTNMFYRG